MPRQLVVEADGGSRGNPGVAGYGALVRDADTGAVLAERAAPLGKESNNVAEYTGLIEGLRAVVEHAPGSLVAVRMDSKLVVEQMAGRWKIKHADMIRLAAQARELVAQLRADGGAVSFEWIPRAKNKDADKLSNDGMDGVTVVRDDWGDRAAAGGPVDGGDGPTNDRIEGADTRHSADGKPADDTAAPTAAARTADMGVPTRLVLVRHGVTEFTTSGKLDGRGGADPALSQAGHAQAERVAEAVVQLIGPAPGGPVSVVTSSLTRAIETGAPVARALGVDPEVDADWDEQAFGDWDGLTFKEIHQRGAGALLRLRNEADFSAPAGESRADVDARVAEAVDRAVAKGGTVVIVTHRIPLMSVLAGVLDLDVDKGWRVAAAPGSLTGVEFWRDGNAQLAFANDTHHLRS